VRISVVIPTLNEEGSIGELIGFILQNGGSAIQEVIVVDANSKDGTLRAASAAGAKALRCTTASRASQMNLGAKHASGHILYFIHADVKLVSTFAADIIQAIGEGFQAGCYRYSFNSPRFILRMTSFFTRFNAIMCRGGDQTLFITRTLFEDLRGFDEYYTIMEDYDLIIRIRRKARFKVIPKKILVSARKYDTNSWARVQLANLTAFMMFFMKKKPDSIRNTYKRMLRYR
jgi:rSAM/selenodomain-associated transferase 2